MKENVQISPQTFTDTIDNLGDPMITVSFKFDRVINGGSRLIGRNLSIDYGKFQMPMCLMFFPNEEAVRIVHLEPSGPNIHLSEEAARSLNIWGTRKSSSTEFQVYQHPNDYIAIVLEKKTPVTTPDELKDWISEVKTLAPKFAQRLSRELHRI